MPSFAERVSAGLARRMDRAPARPANLVYWYDDRPPTTATVGLALQHVAIQSIYFVVPVVLASSLSTDPADASRYLSLSILAVAVWQILQLLQRGAIGSGYPIPGTHTAAYVTIYTLCGAAGIGFGGVGAMLILTGLACLVLTFVMHRLRAALPNEVAGVVVMLIGIALLVVGTQRLGLQPGGTLPDRTAVLTVAVSVLLMAAIALSKTRAAPLAVLFGSVVGIPLAIALGHGYPNAGEILSASPWFAVPQPWMPRFAEIQIVPLLAFIVAIISLKATAVGGLTLMQRAGDASWSRPDAPPIRRGLLANALGIMVSGCIGAACPGPAAAAVGLSVATGTLARRIVWVGAGVLVGAALCPKLITLFILIPEPIKAAMLFYVSGFIMAQGCQLVTARLLDTRRMLVVAFGLSSGIAVAVAPQAFIVGAPVLASPIAVGALVAFTFNLVTLPLVSRRSITTIPLVAGGHRAVTDWFEQLSGTWALKRQTASDIEHAMYELTDVLMELGVQTLALSAHLAEDRVEVKLEWTGSSLPDPPKMADIEDLMGEDEQRHRFAVWLASRRASSFRQRSSTSGNETWLTFED